jgi:hypothetical protein
MTRAIEIVTFKLMPAAATSEFVQAAEETSRFLASCEGFIRRCLSQSDDGSWLDHVEGDTLGEAKAAASGFSEQTRLAAFMAAIEARTAVMRHDTSMLATD